MENEKLTNEVVVVTFLFIYNNIVPNFVQNRFSRAVIYIYYFKSFK